MSDFYCDIPLNAPTASWITGCASDDFKHIAAGLSDEGNTGVNISNDYGQTWYNPLNGLSANGSSTGATRSIACSNDFSRLTLVKQSGNLFTSSDYGVTWSKNTELPAKNWFYVCGSNDMTIQAAVVKGGLIWLSTNSGSTWTASTAPTANWSSICCSGDGSKLAAVVNNGNIYTSADSGANWTNRSDSAGTRYWRNIACSSDGGNLVATVENNTTGTVVISRDSGATWTNISLPAGASKSYKPVSCSADFKNILVGSFSQTNFIYSTNYGYDWTTNQNGESYWFSCIVKGNKFFIARYLAKPFIGQFGIEESPYKVNGQAAHSLIYNVGFVSSTTGALVEQPTDYINPYYAFDFSSGTVDGFTNQTSTGMDVNLIFERSTTSVVFKNLSSLTSPGNVFPNGNPAQVIYIPNTTTSTTPSFIQDRKTTSPTLYIPQFQNVSISFWMNPITVDIYGNYIVIIDISPESSSSVITIAIDGTYKNLVVNLNNLFSGNRVVTPTVVPINTWSHVVFTFNSQTQIGKLYWNGTNVSSTNYGVTLNYFKFIVIGLKYGENAQNAGKKAYNGYLAFYKMFNREITQTEVNFLYNYPGQPFTNINANSLSQIYGGFPFMRGQPPFGDSIYSKVNMPLYNTSNIVMQQFAPYYTCYSPGGPYSLTLRALTNRILVIAIGAGGGGGGGNYQNGGTNGGAGGGGGGGGMAYTYYAVSSSDTISVTVGSGGDGGKTQVTLSSGSSFYIGGNGIGGGDSYVSVNSVEICRGYGGARSKHTSNSNADTGVYNTSITAALNAVGGNGGNGGTYTASTNMGVSGGTNGSIGSGGTSDPDNNSNSTAGGTGGAGGSSSGLTIGGQTVISNEETIIFLKSFYTQLCTGASFRTLFGKGGNGGNGEGGNNGSSAVGSSGTGGGVFIFEYFV